MSVSVLALILARGGSKSIPRKNILPLAGKPLLAYTIEQAKASALITRVIVSTDDEEIAAVAREWGAETPFLRPAEFARDDSKDYEAFRHALLWLLEHEGKIPELVVQLRPTNPVRKVALIDKAIQKILGDPAADSLKSVSRPAESPYKMWRESGAYLEPLVSLADIPEPHCEPRQKLPQVFWQNGYVDIIRSHVILEKEMMYGTNVLPFFIEEKIHELDYYGDLPALEKALRQTQPGSALPVDPEIRHSV